MSVLQTLYLAQMEGGAVVDWTPSDPQSFLSVTESE